MLQISTQLLSDPELDIAMDVKNPSSLSYRYVVGVGDSEPVFKPAHKN